MNEPVPPAIRHPRLRDRPGHDRVIEPAAHASIELVRGVRVTGILLHGDPDAPAGARPTRARAPAIALAIAAPSAAPRLDDGHAT